jgi:hypothetical protein
MNEGNTNIGLGIEAVNAVIHLLWSVDYKKWSYVISLFGPSVEVVYTSLSGGSLAIQHSDDLFSGWEKFIPWFDKTQCMEDPVLLNLVGN